MSKKVITIRGTCLAWEEVCSQAKVVVPVWESATSGEDQDQLQLWTTLISCNISGRRWTCPHLISSGTSLVLAFATCRGSGGYVVLNICALRNILLFDLKGKTKEEVFKEQEKRAEKKSCVGLCYLTKVRCQPYSLVNPNVIHFYPYVKIDQRQDQIGLERFAS